ncbi:MAG: AarF/UbiB family protein [Thermaurantiacus sp.]
MATGAVHVVRLLADARRLAGQGALRPFEAHADVPAGARVLARTLRFGTAAPDPPQLAEGLKACGPAAVKLGQALATRPDLVGPAAADDLKRLQDDMPAVSWPIIAKELDRALGAGWREGFAEISETPVGSASIAQVHKAVTTSGDIVALKVLRPGVEDQFTSAIETYAWAAARLERLGGEFARLRPRQVIETFRGWTMAELDLRREAGNASELAEAVRAEPGIRVPRVHWQWTTRRTLALEWVDGIKLTDSAALDAAGADRPALAQTLVRGFLAQAIGKGFFHADLHQGNLLLDRAGRLVLLDFGIMGHLDRRARVYLAEIIFGLLVGDYARVADIHFEAGYVPPHHDRMAFATALRAAGEPIRGKDASQISIGNLLDNLFAITRQFDMETQPHLLLLQKTMVMVEGVAIGLDPEVNMWETAGPYVKAWLREELGPEARVADRLLADARLFVQLPDLARRLIRQLPPDSAAPPLPTPPPETPQTRSMWPAFLAGLALGLFILLLSLILR